MKLFIRNMACESCKIVVKDALDEVELVPTRIDLGIVEIKESSISDDKRKKLNKIIKEAGLELTESKGSILIEQIKQAVFEYVRSGKPPKLNLSDYLIERLSYEYNYLSNVFTDIEGVTITEYYTALRIEYAKELIMFENLTFSEIAEKLHYSSLSHFSAHFKKATGQTPTQFSKQKAKRRYSVQELSKHLKSE